MYLQQQLAKYYPPAFALAAAACLGTTQKTNVDRTWPIEHIVLTVDFVVGSNLTFAPASAQTPDQYENIIQILQHVNLSINPGNGLAPRSVVDISGVRLLEYAYLTGLNLDPSTLWMIGQAQGTTLVAGAYTLTYMIPMVETRVGEPLRSRLLLPVHKYTQDPVLSVTFNTLAGMGVTAGTITSLSCSVGLVRREVTAASEAILAQTPTTNPWGYIDWDLVETPFTVAPGITGEQRYPLPLTGQYVNLLISQYLGGANITRNVIDATGAGNTVANGFGNESRWRIESGLAVLREWRWKDVRFLNALSAPRNGLIATYSPFFGGPSLASTNFQSPSCIMHDFIGDGITGDNNTELGSLLDCNLAASLKMEIIGTPISVATNASVLTVAGRRFFGDLSKWQAFA